MFPGSPLKHELAQLPQIGLSLPCPGRCDIPEPIQARDAAERPADWPAFIGACQRIGADPEIVQASGGNASRKGTGPLHLKASCFWLKDCLTKEMFVDLDLAPSQRGGSSGGEDFSKAVLAGPRALKPSIESGFHALMPQRVALHAHPVNAACRHFR